MASSWEDKDEVGWDIQKQIIFCGEYNSANFGKCLQSCDKIPKYYISSKGSPEVLDSQSLPPCLETTGLFLSIILLFPECHVSINVIYSFKVSLLPLSNTACGINMYCVHPYLAFVTVEYLICCMDVLIFVTHWPVDKHLSCWFFSWGSYWY